MKGVAVAGVIVIGVMSGCASHQDQASPGQGRVVASATDGQRQSLLERVQSLEGEWTLVDPQTGEVVTASVFTTSSGGSTVREVMFPGTSHEMTNMYHMDGSTLVMTHYCAVGNQPRMRATGATGNEIAFKFDSVTNKTSANQHCMGEMTIEFKDADHIVQKWRNVGGDHHGEGATFELARKK